MSVCDVVAAKPNIKTFLHYTWSGDIFSSQQHMSSIISYTLTAQHAEMQNMFNQTND